MSDDLVMQIKEQLVGDHVRGCQGRQYSCDCGFDLRGEGLLEQSAALLESQAKALSEKDAEIARLQSYFTIACEARDAAGYVGMTPAEAIEYMDARALAAEAHAEKAESALVEAVDERDRLRDDIRQLWDFGTEELRVCEHCDAWMTIEEAARVDDVSLCPREAYGSVKFPDEKCFKHRAWVVKEERDNTRRFIASQEPAEQEK